jgi:hypothetical protein
VGGECEWGNWPFFGMRGECVKGTHSPLFFVVVMVDSLAAMTSKANVEGHIREAVSHRTTRGVTHLQW